MINECIEVVPGVFINSLDIFFMKSLPIYKCGLLNEHGRIVSSSHLGQCFTNVVPDRYNLLFKFRCTKITFWHVMKWSSWKDLLFLQMSHGTAFTTHGQ